jgi:hypothetical protein
MLRETHVEELRTSKLQTMKTKEFEAEVAALPDQLNIALKIKALFKR